MLNRIIGIVILLMAVHSLSIAQSEGEMFTIYLVRHAEKDLSSENSRNPTLTECGKLRAENFANFFSDIDIGSVYSSDYIRTVDTANPVANAKEIKVELYNPRQLGEVANSLLRKKQDALVVGHSNSTGQLAGLLIGEEVSGMDESIYDRIYQVVVSSNSSRLHIMHTSFTCKENHVNQN